MGGDLRRVRGTTRALAPTRKWGFSLTSEQLIQARAERMRQNGLGTLTLEDARTWIEEVRKSGTSHVERLNAADRRIVHLVATEYSDIKTFSEGEGQERRITITQASS